MGINCAPLVADLVLLCYERDFMMSLPDDKQADDKQAHVYLNRFEYKFLRLHINKTNKCCFFIHNGRVQDIAK